MDNLEWLHKYMRNHPAGSPQRNPVNAMSNVPGAGDASAKRGGRGALDLVYQAAEVVRGIEQRANEFEEHARGLAVKAVERLKLAKNRIQELEKQQLEAEACINEAHAKLQQAGERLRKERARALAAESQLPELEMRARSAEARAEECEKILACVEDVVRSEFLIQRSPVSSRLNAAA